MARFSLRVSYSKRVSETRRRFSKLTAITIVASLLSVAPEMAAEPVSPKISLLSLEQLRQKLQGESNTQERAKIAKNILDVGIPLIAGPMAPSAAKTVADSLKAGRGLADDQKGYVSFWLLRAVASVEADEAVAGIEAAKVLREIGMMQSEKKAEIELMALLNTKGWLNAPESIELQRLRDAVNKGDLKSALKEADALLEKYPQNAKLIDARKAIEAGLSKTTLPAANAASAGATPHTGASFQNSLGRAMVWIPSLHIWVGETEVTQREFRILMDQNPSEHIGDHLPVESVTAFEAKEWCDRLTKKDAAAGLLPPGYVYMLPTDEQWTVFCGNATLEDAVTSRDRARAGPEPVKSLGPNEYGIYDTRGNVWEWTRTQYDSSLNSPEIRAEYPFGVVQSGPRKGAMKGLDPDGLVLRGGSWRSKDGLLNKTTRGSNAPSLRDGTNGFRVVLVPAE